MASMDHPELEAKLELLRRGILQKVRDDPAVRGKMRSARDASRPIPVALYQLMLQADEDILRAISHTAECPANDGGDCACAQSGCANTEPNLEHKKVKPNGDSP